MPLIQNNLTLAERYRGGTKGQLFDSPFSVARNQGVITGILAFSNGYAAFTSTTMAVNYFYALTHAVVSVVMDVNFTTFTSGSYQTLISLGNSGTGYSWEFGISNTASTSAKKLYYYNGTTTYESTTTTTTGLHKVAFVYDGTNVNFYVDGALLGTAVTANAPATTFGKVLYIGVKNLNTQTANSSIASFKVFNAALTAQEVSDFYTNSTYSYINKRILHLPMSAAAHDYTNKLTLDDSGNGLNATLGDGSTLARFPTKRVTRGYSFDGGDWMRIENAVFNPTSYSSFTMGIWVIQDAWTSSDLILDQRDGGPTGGLSLQQTGSTNALAFITANGGSGTGSATFGVCPLSQWIFLLATYDGTNLTSYLNGVQVTLDTSSVMSSTSAVFSIGSRSATTSNAFNGQMAEFSVWKNKVLTPLQILDLYLTGKNLLRKV